MAVSHNDRNEHAGRMDDIYRYQRLIYDVTRKYYLLGRDRLIREMEPEPGTHILEIACGTGRNLDCMDRLYPGRHLYGLDISEQMLETAREKLAGRVLLAHGDACSFDPVGLFGRESFDHIVLSYSLSMIPDWQGALSQALAHLAPGGTLHIVDFGDLSRLPGSFSYLLRKWLEQFHVQVRDDLSERLVGAVSARGLALSHVSLYLTYAQMAKIKS